MVLKISIFCPMWLLVLGHHHIDRLNSLTLTLTLTLSSFKLKLKLKCRQLGVPREPIWSWVKFLDLIWVKLWDMRLWSWVEWRGHNVFICDVLSGEWNDFCVWEKIDGGLFLFLDDEFWFIFIYFVIHYLLQLESCLSTISKLDGGVGVLNTKNDNFIIFMLWLHLFLL